MRLFILCCLLAVTASAAPQTVHVFYDTDVYFDGEDNRREVSRTLDLPSEGNQVIAHLKLRPIPKEMTEVHDKWDRAGHIALRQEGLPDVEIVKFVTSYGGYDDHEIDVTYLRPLLKGSAEIVGFIDTWVKPGWKLDFSLEFRDRSTAINDEWAFFENRPPDWIEPAFNMQEVRVEASGGERTVTVPDGLETVALYYLVSGHCQDGQGADEFVSKDNVIFVDDAEAYRFKPWRPDCREYRDRNPYTRRWSNGTWSSDFSRSGWCPGDDVVPISIDLTEQMTPGDHTVRFDIEDIRPQDDSGFGYWRVSAVVLGWKAAP